jgi:hypothetical protein
MIGTVTPVMKFAPRKVTGKVAPGWPFVGVIDVSTGWGFTTIKLLLSVCDPPPGASFLTVTLRVTVGAFAAIEIVTVE